MSAKKKIGKILLVIALLSPFWGLFLSTYLFVRPPSGVYVEFAYSHTQRVGQPMHLKIFLENRSSRTVTIDELALETELVTVLGCSSASPGGEIYYEESWVGGDTQVRIDEEIPVGDVMSLRLACRPRMAGDLRSSFRLHSGLHSITHEVQLRVVGGERF